MEQKKETMESANLKNKTISAFFWQLLQRISGQLISFSVSVVLARILMPADYGVVALAGMFTMLFGIFIDGGLGVALIQKKEIDDLDYNTVFYSGFVLSFVAYFAIFFSAPYFANLFDSPQLTLVLRILPLTMPIGALSGIQSAILKRQIEFRKFFYSSITGTVLSAIVGLTMALTGWGVWALVAQMMVSSLTQTIILFYIVRWYPRFVFSYDRFKGLFSFGWKLMVIDLFSTFNYQLKGYVIGMKYSPSDLAYYNRGEGLPSILQNNINGSINSVLFPALSRLQDDPLAVKKALARAMRTTSFILMPCLLGLAAISDKLVIIIFSDKWEPAIPYMQIICLTNCFNILGMANLQALKAIGRSGTLLKMEFIKRPLMISMIIAAMFISPMAIVSSMCLYAFLAFVINAFPNKKHIKYSIAEQIGDIAPCLFTSIVMGILIYVLGRIDINMYICVFIQIVAGAILYILLARIFNRSDLLYVLDYVKERFHKKGNQPEARSLFHTV